MILEALFSEIESAIQALDVNPQNARGEEPGQWLLVDDFCPVFIDAWEEKESSPWNYFIFEKDPTIFQLIIPAFYAPTLKRDALFEELLTVNLNLQYAKFSFNKAENIVVLSMRKPGHTFSQTELKPMIDALSYYAEMTYQVLKDEFSLKKVSIE